MRHPTAAEDETAPAEIEHVHEEIGEDGEVWEIYDYLIYRFETDAGEVVARAYTDEMHTVSIMTRGEGGETIDPPPGVRRFLFRRFHAVRALGPDGYRPLRRGRR